ncbi:hypothetical protein [Streptomyces sp. NPDC051554]|uniref:zinc finger domain-containing protein n=1 Tax=Streptomyces sp. NPDC051554 TaxID=3365656 RepID=UPI00378E1A5F
MTASEPVQAPRTAWMNRMRAEALRARRPEISKIVHVGWVIASYADSDGTNACPKTPTIAAIVGSSEETVTRAKRVLKALDVLVEKRRPNTSSEYRLQQPMVNGTLDWDAHLHLYTDTPQARHKKKAKERQIAEHLAVREQELAAARNPSQEGFQEVRNPFPQGVPEELEPVPAGGSETPPGGSGTRSGTGAEPVAERDPEPVPAGGEQREEHKGPDKDAVGAGPRPPVSLGDVPESQFDEGEKTGRVLASVPAPPGRARKTAPADGPTQPPLLLAVPGQDAPTADRVRQTIADHGVPAALRRYGRELVMRELTTDCESPRHHQGPAELTVPCGYCKAPTGAACRSSDGLRGLVHEARRDAWDVAYANCPGCKATAGSPCTDPGAVPRHGIHPQRAEFGARMRKLADAQPRTETGT